MPNTRLESMPVASDATATTALINNQSLNTTDNTAYLAARSAGTSTAGDVLPMLDICVNDNQGTINISGTQADNGANSSQASDCPETQITISGNSGNITIDEGGSDTAGSGTQQISITDNSGTININEGNAPQSCDQPSPPQSNPGSPEQPPPPAGTGDQPNPPQSNPGSPEQPPPPAGTGDQPNPPQSNPGSPEQPPPISDQPGGSDPPPVPPPVEQPNPPENGSGGGPGDSTSTAPTAAQVAGLDTQIATSNGVAAHFEGKAMMSQVFGNTKDVKFESRRESVYLNNASLQWAAMSNMFGGGTVQTPDIQQSTPADQVKYDQQQMALYQAQFQSDEKAYTQGGSTGNAQLEQEMANDAATMSALDSDEILNLPDNYYNHNEPQQYATQSALGLPANTQSY